MKPGSPARPREAVALRRGMCRLESRIVLAFCLIQIVLLSHALAAVGDQAVVVNPNVPITDISGNGLRGIFGMRLRVWPDGTPIRVFVLPDNAPEHEAFSKRRLSIFPHQLRRAWDRLVYSGLGQAPIRVQDTDEMLSRSASSPGAIGYLPVDMLNDTDMVRVVEVP